MLPRYVELKDNTIIWNSKYVTVHEDIADKLLLKNVFYGHLISGNIYPLIYDNENNITMYRSMEFYEKFKDLHSVPNNDKIQFHIGLRDLYFASTKNILNESEKSIIRKVIKKIDEPYMNLMLGNLPFSPTPTKQFIVPKYTNLTSLEEEVKQYFIKNKVGLHLIFVSPEDLSYHNFENIIDLDFCPKIDGTGLYINNVDFFDNQNIYKIDSNGALLDHLLELDKLDLYTIPLNNLMRGGSRFIFRSQWLADRLFVFIKNTNLPIIDHLVKINEVFRYNKFAPNDPKFTNHYDTPYYDSQYNHCSKYTLLIYLSGGDNSVPILKIDKTEFNAISKNTIIIFDQQYEHEGNTYQNSDKIFLRTELIYEGMELDYDYNIAKLFNVGCYMTKESLFNKKLQKYSNDIFNQTTKLRHSLCLPMELELLVKYFNGIQFVTNGHDYWFPDIDLKEIAIAIIVDNLGAKTAISVSLVKEINQCSNEDIKKYLKYTSPCERLSKMLTRIINPKKKPVIEYDYTNCCCLFHKYDLSFFEYPEVIKEFNQIYDQMDKINVQDSIGNYTVILFGNKLKFNLQNIIVTHDSIEFKISEKCPRLNFASCWSPLPENHIGIEKDVIYFNLPKIKYVYQNGIYCLEINLFDNGFKFKKDTVPYLFIKD